jgi:hypothetical protein
VDEHAEFHVLKFATGLKVFRGGLVRVLTDCRDNEDRKANE